MIELAIDLPSFFSPVVSPTGSRPPSRNWNNEMPGDEELGFEAAVAALGECLASLSYARPHLSLMKRCNFGHPAKSSRT